MKGLGARGGGEDEGLKFEGGFRLEGGLKPSEGEGGFERLEGGFKGASRGLHLRKAGEGASKELEGGLKRLQRVRKLGTRILLPPALLSKQQDSPQLPQWIVNPFRTTQAHRTRSVLFT